MIVEPLHLNLDVIDPSQSYQSVNKVVRLINVEGRRVAFKIRTTARNMFSTTPNSSLLEPGQEMDIIVTMVGFTHEQYKEVSSSMACTDKFLVRAAPAADSITGEFIRGQEAGEWWNSRPKSEVTDQVITCTYVRQASTVEIGQTKLRFVKCVDEDRMVGSSKVLAEETLLLLNNTSKRHAFKIRTTARDRYRVEPSCGLIDKGTCFRVNMSMVLACGATSDKFQIRCCLAESEDIDDAQVKKNDFWALPAVRESVDDMTLESVLVSDIPSSRSSASGILGEHQQHHQQHHEKGGGVDTLGSQPESRLSKVEPRLSKVEPNISLAFLPTEMRSSYSREHPGDSEPYDKLLKIVLVGDSDVGKTALLSRFCDDSFLERSISTIGVDFRVRMVSVGKQERVVKMQVWDTAGQERFRTITSSNYRGADGIIVVYDITNQESFHHVDDWMREIQKFTSDGEVRVLLVGNKADLNAARQVQAALGAEYSSLNSVPFVETSAKTAAGVEEAFETMAGLILDAHALADTEASGNGSDKGALLERDDAGGGERRGQKWSKSSGGGGVLCHCLFRLFQFLF